MKTLCRLRCVSKGWRALISDPAAIAAAAAAPLVVGVFGRPYFGEMFHAYGPPRPPYALLESLELRLIETADGTVLKVVKDVKGIKLMHARLGLVFIDLGEYGFTVIDPATGQVLKVGRQPPDLIPTGNYNGTRTIVDYKRCHYSFGRATLSGAYKIICLRDVKLRKRDAVQICQIATLGEGDGIGPWRQRPEPPILTCTCSDCAAFVDGVLHFMCRGADAYIHGRRLASSGWNRIASFDLESEEWKMVMDGPPTECPKREEEWDMALAELKVKGTLSVVETVWSPHRSYSNIWLLVDPKKSIWVKEYTVQMPKCWGFSRPLEILADGRILMLNCFGKDFQDLLKARCVLQFYDPSTHALTNLMEMSKEFKGPLTLYTRNLGK